MGEDGEGAVRGGVVLLLEPGGAVGADGGVVGEVGGEDGFGGRDVGVEDGFFGGGVGDAVDLGGARGLLEEGDGVGEVDCGGAAFFEVVEAGLDVGDGVLWCCGGWSGVLVVGSSLRCSMLNC